MLFLKPEIFKKTHCCLPDALNLKRNQCFWRLGVDLGGPSDPPKSKKNEVQTAQKREHKQKQTKYENSEKKTWKNGVIDGAFQNYSKENQLIITGNYVEGRVVSKKCFTAERLEIPCE